MRASHPPHPLTLALSDGHQVEVVSEDGYEVVVRCGYNWWYISRTGGLGLGLKEVITDRAVHHTLPMLLHKYLPKRWGILIRAHCK